MGYGFRYGNIGRRIAKSDSLNLDVLTLGVLNLEPVLPDNPDREERLDAWLALTGRTTAPQAPVRLPMLSGSMRPAIPVGAFLEVEPATGERCRPGDIVVYRAGDKLVAHRILWRISLGGRRLFFEKGDTNKRGRWIRGARVCGLVTAFHVDLERHELSRDKERVHAERVAVAREFLLRAPRRLRKLLPPARG